MSHRTITLISALVLVACGWAWAESVVAGDPRIAHLGLADGISDASVHTLLQDSTGFLWIGTGSGLDRFDGHQLRRYGLGNYGEGRFPSISISYLFEKDGLMWIGTWGGGITVFDLATEKVVQTWVDELSDARVQVITDDRDGRMLIGTYAGLSILETDGSWRHISRERGSQLPADRIWDITEDDRGEILLATSGGIAQIDPLRGHLQRLATDASKALELETRSFLQASDGSLWIGTGAGLWHRAPDHEEILRVEALEGMTINDILEDSAGRIWIATLRAGLLEMDPVTGTTEVLLPPRIAAENVRCMMIDSSENLWIGTRTQGVSRIDLKPPKFRSTIFENDNGRAGTFATVYDLVLDPHNRLWAGSSLGLLELDPEDGHELRWIRQADGLADQGVECLAIDPQRHLLWIGSLSSLGWLNLESGEIQAEVMPRRGDALSAGDQVLSLLFRDDRLWIGTRGGLRSYQPSNGTWLWHLAEVDTSLRNAFVTDLAIDPQGNLLVATDRSAVFAIDRDDGSLLAVYLSETTDTGRIETLAVDGESIWVGAQHGLFKVAGGKLVDTGAFAHKIMSIEPSPEALWVATDRELTRYQPLTGEGRAYGSSDGISRPPFSADASQSLRGGRFVFGSARGLTVVDPERLIDSPFLPSVAITGVDTAMAIPTDPSHRQQTLTLPHDLGSIGLNFAAFDFTAPDELLYRYRLDGADKDWTTTDQPTVRYASIQPGNYVFRVQATNADGVWSPREARLALHVKPPLHATWWMRTLILLIVIGGGAAAARVRFRSIEVSKHQLENLVQRRTLELEEANLELERIASLDPLTGVANRRQFFARAEELWRSCRHDGQPLTIVMLDLDHFKAFNDTRGHQEGDAALRRVAHLLDECVSEAGGMLARYGGEELIAIFAGVASSRVRSTIEHAARRLENEPIGHPASPFNRLTFSAGIASTIPSSANRYDQLIELADEALYRGKQAGRNVIIGGRRLSS